jgi:hypothetical protein
MLNVVNVIDTPYLDIGGGTRIHLGTWNAPLAKVLSDNRNCDLYIYRPTLHSPSIRGVAVTKSFINRVRRDSR